MGEVVIDAETATKHRYAVGDSIGVSANGPVQQFRIVGTATYGKVSSLGGATFAEANVEMRIAGVTMYWIYRNANAMRASYVAGLGYPKYFQFYGVRWVFTN